MPDVHKEAYFEGISNVVLVRIGQAAEVFLFESYLFAVRGVLFIVVVIDGYDLIDGVVG
jgi:hypothetical protein